MLIKDPPYPEPVRRMIFDGTPLLPVGSDSWRLPNGEGVVTTKELHELAQRRRVWCVEFIREAKGEKRND
jgi:hypothetical protein